MAALTGSIDYAQLKDRSVIITGGASGLGEATTKLFAEHGAYVTIADMDVGMGEKLTLDLTAKGQKVTFVECDTTDWSASVHAFKHAIKFSAEGTLDVAILFAGTDGARTGLVDEVLKGPEPSLEDNPIEPKHNAIDVNLLGEYLSTSLALHYFRLPGGTSRKKSIVLISSMTGYIDLPYNTDYSVSKYGIRGLFRSIRSQAHRVNARVNNLVPGYILTPLTKRVHQIESPEEPSKATGYVLPWAPIEFVVEACARCAVDDSLDGRALAVMPSGVIDINEDVETGYGGERWVKMLERDGFMNIPSLFPKK
jgi:5'-hydroxyaverantin dehydrogenase